MFGGVFGMVRELRQLTFAPSEVSDALELYRGQHPDFLPAGGINVRGVARDGALRVRVSMNYGNTRQYAVFDIAASDVVRALVCACVDMGIPIPSSGEKSLSGSTQGVRLNIRIDGAGKIKENRVALDQFSGAREIVPENA